MPTVTPKPDPGLVFDDGAAPGEARTHVLIVAVGRYPAFRDGGRTADPEAPLRQLVSPPPSGRALAQWFIEEYVHDAAPLGTVSLLVSEPGPMPFAAAGRPAVPVIVPTYGRFQKAAQAWAQRGGNPASRLIFIFSGHGYGYGGESSLLMSDFDLRRLNCWDHALHLGAFTNGMAEIPAAEQIYFIDACRTPYPTFLGPDAVIGRSPVQPRRLEPRAGLPRRTAPIYFSTSDDQPARGRKGGLSVFTHAFLDAVGGMAARDDEGDWRVGSLSLLEAMDHVSQRLTREAFPQPQQPQGAESRAFQFHRLTADPVAPVYVTRQDGDACGPGELHFEVHGTPRTQTCGVDDVEVVLPLPLGSYDLELKDPSGGTVATGSAHSAPIYKRAVLVS